jgi:hypothetical protein
MSTKKPIFLQKLSQMFCKDLINVNHLKHTVELSVNGENIRSLGREEFRL